MEINKRIELIIQNGINYGKYNSKPYKNLLNLGLDESIIDVIKAKVDQKQNFQIEVNNLLIIVVALQKKIENLLQHPDFDPVKEELRSKFKEQYESYPLDYKGNRYYLYPKSARFPVDEEISNTVGFMKILQAHIHESKPLKYNYKEYID